MSINLAGLLALIAGASVAALVPASKARGGPIAATRLQSLAGPRLGERVHEFGERTRVKLTGGAPKKLRKKQRRSRSPILYPCRTAGGTDAWLQVASTQTHILSRGTEYDIPAFVSRVEDGDDDADVLVLSPTAAALRDGVTEAARAPRGGRRLDELKTNDRVEATVLRLLGSSAALVAVQGVYRAVSGGFRRQAALLPDARGLAVGATLHCHVKLAEPQSGRLTVSLDPIEKGDLKKQKTEARLRKQLKRGTLAVGRNRLATIITSQDGSLEVDAGGLVATVAAPDGDGPFAPGDRVMTRVAALDEATLEATLEYVPVEGLYDDDGEPAESSE